MPIRLPWRRLESWFAPFGPLVPLLFVDLLVLPKAFDGLRPNEPQVRLNLALAASLTAACGAWYLLRARGVASSACGTALALAAYALTARAALEMLVGFHGGWLEDARGPEREVAWSLVRFGRTFGLVAFAWALGAAAGEVVNDLRARRPASGR